MKIVVIGSGSDGNSTYIKGDTATILIDAGISFRQIKSRLASVGINDYNFNALFITHEHGDHTKYIGSIVKNTGVKYYMAEMSYYNVSSAIFSDVKIYEHGFVEPFSSITINDMKISFISLSHDSLECLGLIIEEHGKRIVYVADTGYLDEDYRDILTGANCYLFEANHDPAMEMESNRPQELKNRVLGDRGHLSNEDSAVNLSYLITDNTKNIIFLHRSRDCNNLDVLKETVFRVFDAFSIDYKKIEFDYAEQNSPTRLIEV